MKEDVDHLNLLAVFYYIFGVMSGLLSCIPLIYVGLGVAMVTGQLDAMDKAGPPPPYLGWVLIGFGLVIIALGCAYAICLLLTGRFLQIRRGYIFCMVIAGLSCLHIPFGTCLGVFTIVVLCRPSVKDLFEHRGAAALQNDPSSQ